MPDHAAQIIQHAQYLSLDNDALRAGIERREQTIDAQGKEIDRLSAELDTAREMVDAAREAHSGSLRELATAANGRALSCSFFDMQFQKGYERGCLQIARDISAAALVKLSAIAEPRPPRPDVPPGEPLDEEAFHAAARAAVAKKEE